MNQSSFFERHPNTTLLCVFLVLFLCLAGLAELVLRATLSYDIGYYMATKTTGRYTYPFGTIEINSRGFPDEEFDLNSRKKRIGYFGDSVTFGTGAGSGYRFSDILQRQFPQYEHWTFGMVNNGIEDMKLADTAQTYELDMAVYALNMNDIMPATPQTAGEAAGGTDSAAGGAAGKEKEAAPILPYIRRLVYRHFDGLRGKSYLYTWLRTLAKNALTRLGYGHMGFRAAELFPTENIAVIKNVARRINAIDRALAENNIRLCVLILPYEMQISEQAARTYSALGIRWEQGFLAGSTQTILRSFLETKHLYNGIEAFAAATPGDDAPAGTFFVYNKGDKIDFNHPNRAGHAKLAEGFIRSGACGFLGTR